MAKLDSISYNGTKYELAPEIAPLFSASTAYSKGDCVIYNAVLYKFTANHSAGAWTGNDVEAIEVADRLNKISDSIGDLKAAIEYIDSAIGAGFKVIKGYYIEASGKIVAGSQYDIFAFKVKNGGKINVLASTSALVYAFYTDEPEIGSTSYNGSRTVRSTEATAYNLLVPSGTNWIAVRVLANGSATIDPMSTIMNDVPIYKGQYSSSLDDVKDNSIRDIPSSVQTSPFYNVSSCILQTIDFSNGAYMQMAYGYTSAYKGMRYTRTYISGAWTAWATFDDDLSNYLKSFRQYTGSLDDVKDNSIRHVGSSVATNPFYNGSACMLQTTILVTGAYMQIAYGISGKYKGQRCLRTYINSAWTDWVNLDSSNAYPSEPLYYAFGDSLTWGAKWVIADNASGYSIVRTAEKYRIPTRIANAVGAGNTFENDGESGYKFVSNNDDTIIKKIKSVDMTGAKLITVAGGRNDTTNPLGNINSTSGDGTICGAVREIIEYIQSTYKKAQIVWIGVTPHASTNDEVFTWRYQGSWNLNEFDEAVSAVCAEYCVPYVNWKECSYMMHWADFSAVAGNYVHPDNDESFLQMGNYVAGKVSKYYKG